MDKSLNEVREKSTTSETVDQHPPPPHSHGQSLWADTPPARVRPGPLCLYLRARRQFTPIHRQPLCSLRSTVLPFAPFALVQVSSVSDQWQERDEWEASWLRDWQPTPHWLSSQRGDRHDQSVWPTRVLTLDAYTQHPLQQHTQEASTQHAPLDHTCAPGWHHPIHSVQRKAGDRWTFRSHRFQRRLPMLLPLHPPMHMVQHRTGAHRVNSTDSDHAERCRNPIKCESTDTSGNQTVLQPQPVPAQREGWPAWAVPPKLVHQSGPRHRLLLARRERQSQAKRL